MLYSILQAGKGASDDPAGQRTKSAQKQAFYQMQKVFFFTKTHSHEAQNYRNLIKFNQL